MYKLSFGKIYPQLKIIAKFQHIEGLERKIYSISKTYPIKITGIQNLDEFSSQLFDEESDYGVIMVDEHHSIKKTYFLNPVKLDLITENSVHIEAFLFGASKGVLKAWENYFFKGVTNYNLWKELKPSQRQGWLELAMSCQNINFENLKTVIEINGSDINSSDDFYCALGEALNGPGGYFGRNLNALADCISSHEFGTKSLKKIIWKNSKKSRWKLKNNFKYIVDLFREFNIEVELD